MKKYLILCFIFVFAFTANAQDKDANHACKDAACCASKYAPQKGDFSAAMLFGRGAYLNGGLVVPQTGQDVPGDAPVANDVSANNNDMTNMIGAEFKYYTSNKFAITFQAGAILRNTPGRVAIPGAAGIPGSDAVVAQENANLHFSLGGQWLLKTKNDRLFPYVGFALPFDYARRSEFDQFADSGLRHVEISSYGVQAVAGADYYVAKDVFFGFDIKPISYAYSYSEKSPGLGFGQEADTDTVSFFAQFSFKVGFKF